MRRSHRAARARFHSGNSMVSVGGCRLHAREIADGASARELRFAQGGPGALLELHHELDAVEGTQGEIVERSVQIDVAAARELPDHVGIALSGIACRRGDGRRRHPPSLRSRRASACSCRRCAAATGCGQTEKPRMRWCGSSLLFAWFTIGSGIGAGIQHQHRVHLFARALFFRHDSGFAHALRSH